VRAINASEQAINQAAPTPCATRAAIRDAIEFERDHQEIRRDRSQHESLILLHAEQGADCWYRCATTRWLTLVGAG